MEKNYKLLKEESKDSNNIYHMRHLLSEKIIKCNWFWDIKEKEIQKQCWKNQMYNYLQEYSFTFYKSKGLITLLLIISPEECTIGESEQQRKC